MAAQASASASAENLHPQWMTWLAENLLLAGQDPKHLANIQSVLVQQGLDAAVAQQLIDDVSSERLMRGAQPVRRRLQQLDTAGRLVRGFLSGGAMDIDHQQAPMDHRLFEHACWFGHRPCVLRKAALDWRSCTASGHDDRWTLDRLAAIAGDAEIEVLVGRDARSDWYNDRDRFRSSMSLADLIKLCKTTQGNDVYAVGRNDLLAVEELAVLADDFGPLPGLAPDERHDRLWVGPKGTLTPLHHDQSAAWLVQLIGTKRVWLASPLEPSLLASARGVFNALDVTQDLGDVCWWVVDLQPGDAVFLPTGWWHSVLSTAPSVSVSRGAFVWPNSHEWYCPGRD